MDQPKNDQNPKHLKGFWPIFSVVIVGLVACAIIYAFAYGNIMQDEINSSSFWTRLSHHQANARLPMKPYNQTLPR